MKKKDLFYGRQPAIEILKSDTNVEKILIQKGSIGDEVQQIKEICRERRITFQIVPKEKINYLLFPLFPNQRVNHQGIVGFYGSVKYYQLDDIYNQLLAKGELALFLVLDGVTDVRNFGAIIRTAEAMGVHAIVIPEKGIATINAETVKASAGAVSMLPICKESSLQKIYEYFKLNGIQIVASSLEAKIQIQQIDFTIPTAIVLGSEGKGIGKTTKGFADHQFIIPMKGEINSLNVSVSSGMILYEALQQRKS